MTQQPVLLAFRYVGAAPRIPLAVRKHEDVDILLTLVDTGVLTVMQTGDGRRITKAIYNVRNNRNQFLRVHVPQGADVWSATVAGRSIRPALDEDGRVLIPLVRSGGASRTLTSFPVELVFVESQTGVEDKGHMKIILPRVQQPVTHLMVQLYVPAKGDYGKGLFGGLSFESPLRRVDAFSQIASAPRPPKQQLSAAAQAQQLQRQFDKRVEAAAVASGVTPIRVDLPIRGKLYRFEKILAMAGDDLHIAFDYSNWDED